MDSLVEAAREASDASHAPYSEYHVGAAIETADGSVYTGCNVENANYSNSLHAEEIAIGAAVRDGHRDFSLLAVSTTERDGQTPCGMCRQTIAEFCDGEFPVVCDDGGDETTEYRLGTLLPATITRTDLE